MGNTHTKNLLEKAKAARKLAEQFRQAADKLDTRNEITRWAQTAGTGLTAASRGTVYPILSSVVPGLAHFINKILENKVIKDLNPQWDRFREKYHGVDMGNVMEDIEQQLTEVFEKRVRLIEKAHEVFADVNSLDLMQMVQNMRIDRVLNVLKNLYDLLLMCVEVFNNDSKSSQMSDSFRKVAEKLEYIAQEAKAKAKKGKK